MSTPAAAEAGAAAIHAPTDDELLLAQRRAAMRRSQKGGVTPDARALALLQESLVRGRWRDHHLNALAADGRTAGWLGGLIECTQNAYEQREQALTLAPKAQAAALKKAQGRNVICLGSAVCPDETVEWYTCVRKAVKSLKDPAVPYEDCAPRRQLLERCSHAAIRSRNHRWSRTGSSVGTRTRYAPCRARVAGPSNATNASVGDERHRAATIEFRSELRMWSSKKMWWQSLPRVIQKGLPAAGASSCLAHQA